MIVSENCLLNCVLANGTSNKVSLLVTDLHSVKDTLKSGFLGMIFVYFLVIAWSFIKPFLATLWRPYKNDLRKQIFGDNQWLNWH